MNRVLICMRFSDRAADLVSQWRLLSSLADTSFPSLSCPHCHTQKVNLLSMAFKVLLEAAQTTPNWTHQPLSSQLPWLAGHALPTLSSAGALLPFSPADCLAVPGPPPSSTASCVRPCPIPKRGVLSFCLTSFRGFLGDLLCSTWAHWLFRYIWLSSSRLGWTQEKALFFLTSAGHMRTSLLQ